MTRAEAQAFIDAVVALRNIATDEQALEATAVYPQWRSDVSYAVGDRVLYGGVLYRCRQAHSSQEIYPPNIIPAIWVAISEDAGTQDAPVTAVRGMEYEADKCYIDLETNKLYRCTRGGILQYLPHELVGHYFEEVAV